MYMTSHATYVYDQITSDWIRSDQSEAEMIDRSSYISVPQKQQTRLQHVNENSSLSAVYTSNQQAVHVTAGLTVWAWPIQHNHGHRPTLYNFYSVTLFNTVYVISK